MSERDDIRRSLDESVESGQMRIVGEDENGEPLYELTADGINHVHDLIDDVLEQATAYFAQQLDLPDYMARELLIHRVIELSEKDA